MKGESGPLKISESAELYEFPFPFPEFESESNSPESNPPDPSPSKLVGVEELKLTEFESKLDNEFVDLELTLYEFELCVDLKS